MSIIQEGIGLWPKPGRSSAIARWGAAEVGEVLEPVAPTAAETVDEKDRLALADLGVVHFGPRQLHTMQMLAPVDL
jgi:hypothetical protein